MATKTFEELKQLAIQIRDEKTNKQNTATRVGTAMLEHINKLEQDYYDKTTINNRTSEYNVSINHPTSGISSSNKYDLSSAIAQVPAELRRAGLTISFLNESEDTEKWEFSGGSWSKNKFTKVGGKELIYCETISKNSLSTFNKISSMFLFKSIGTYEAQSVQDGYLNEDGSVSTSTRRGITDFIEVSNISAIRLLSGFASIADAKFTYAVLYDASKNIISAIKYSTALDDLQADIFIPDGVKYII